MRGNFISSKMFRIVLFCLTLGCSLGAIPYKLVNENVNLEGLPYIILGENAEDGKYPYQVSLHVNLGSKKHHMCGASILTKNWVMTAGHCCKAGAFDILVGTNSLSKGGATYRTFSTKIHPKYDAANNWKNDICLIKTSTPIAFSSTVQPVTLPPQDAQLKEGDFLNVTGWGYTTPVSTLVSTISGVGSRVDLTQGRTDASNNNFTDSPQPEFRRSENKVAPDRLQLGKNYKYVPPSKCANLTGISAFEGYLCVVGNRDGQGICQGDSGGPIVRNGVQFGIASWIFMPCGNILPDFFARVPNYINWIKESLGADAKDLKFSS